MRRHKNAVRNIDERLAVQPDKAAIRPQKPGDETQRQALARARLPEQGGDALPISEGDGKLEGPKIEADVNLDHSKLATRFSAQR